MAEKAGTDSTTVRANGHGIFSPARSHSLSGRSGERRHRHVERRSDRAKKFGFAHEDLSIGTHDMGGGGEGALLDGQAGGGEFVERSLERGKVAGGFIGEHELRFD